MGVLAEYKRRDRHHFAAGVGAQRRQDQRHREETRPPYLAQNATEDEDQEDRQDREKRAEPQSSESGSLSITRGEVPKWS